MSEENFLTRWSRRKRAAQEESDVRREAAADQITPADPLPVPSPLKSWGPEARPTLPSSQLGKENSSGERHSGDAGRALPPAPERGRVGEGVSADLPLPDFDLSTLPSLESITAATDIRPFLAPGVPQALRSAALRRAWSADPAIRDFVGLAENAWDFTAPGAIAGFGTLSASEAARAVASFTEIYSAKAPEEAKEAAPDFAENIPTSDEERGEGAAQAAPPPQPETSAADGEGPPVRTSELELPTTARGHGADSTIKSAEQPEDEPIPPRHGTAMPH
jgi:Protein of unknown function (DUF3306)